VKSQRPPTLEKLSWLAAVLGLALATVTWLVPEPMGVADLALKPPEPDGTLIGARPLVVFLLLAFAFTAFAFGFAAKGEALRFHVEFRGDWAGVVVVMAGVYILVGLVGAIVTGALILNSLTGVIVAALLGSALLMAMSAFSRRYRGVHIRGEVDSESRRGWPRVAAFLALAGFLATLLFALTFLQALFGKPPG